MGGRAVLIFIWLTANIGQPQNVRLSLDAHRVALVIGNQRYLHVKGLDNPVRDAKAMQQVLEGTGFQVIERENVDREAFESVLNDFVHTLRKGDVALVYYSGHGMQIEGENYLAPIDLNAQNAIQARNRSISASEILQEVTASGADLQIMILDACRDNPFFAARSVGSKGLATMMTARGSFIAFATAPGQTADDNRQGQNGLYTSALLNALNAHGLSIEQVFKEVARKVDQASNGRQVPWVESNLTGEFYFRPSRVGASAGDSSEPKSPFENVESRLAYEQCVRLNGLNSWDESIAACTRALDSNPESAEALLQRGFAYHQLGKNQEAVEDLTELIHLRPGDADARQLRADAFSDLRNYEKAIEDYSAVLGRKQDADVLILRGVAYRNLGQNDRALADFSAALHLQPSNMPAALDNRGVTFFFLHNYDDAMRDFNAAIGLNANVAAFYRNRALVYQALGKKKEARADEAKATKLSR